ncbi:CcdB family protein [Roseateles sp.]|uniref:CcdB family protein n=1 Tax=Roseateles sp. TaxID=1971397 RepID=UPI0025E2ABE8|nr:CcdB family protein [Roseateles sp.]MBV8035926.1 CcdB family protein [Roseateles sp.]
MARFDVFRNAGPHAASTPFLVDVQINLLDGLETSVVIPLRRLDRFVVEKLPAQLCPVFEIEGLSCLLETPKMAAVPRRFLKERVTSLAREQHRVMGALDFLFQGY